MARYVFSMCANGKCVVYDESTPEEDKMDAGFAEFGSSGYNSFWVRCKMAYVEFRDLVHAVHGMKTIGTILPGCEWLADISPDDITATITDLYYDVERTL